MAEPARLQVVERGYRSQGPEVIRFGESTCIHGPGDWYGRPFRFRPWQKQIINRMFRLRWDPRAGRWRRQYRRVLLGLPSGAGKTELAAVVANYFLFGRQHVDPEVAVAANSREQAGLVFGAAKVMASESRQLSPLCEPGTDRITLRGEPGTLYRVAAAEGTNDGKRISCLVADELHEWTDRKRTFDILTKSTAKRLDSFQLFITTAGFDLDTICGRLYERGRAIERGEVLDDGYLMIWYEAPEGADPADPETWRLAHPAYDDFMSAEALRQKFDDLPINVFRRYFLNQWVEAEAQWLPDGAWAACRREYARDIPLAIRAAAAGQKLLGAGRSPEAAVSLLDRALAAGFEPGAPTWVGWDASTKHDSTAVVAVQRRTETDEDGEERSGVVVLARAWERPTDANGKPVANWIIPVDDVTGYLWDLARVFDVQAVGYDPAFVVWEAAKLAEAGLPMLEFPQSPGRMSEASQGLYEAIVHERMLHDGDPALARHIKAAAAKQQTTGSGAWRLVKGMGKRPMDLAIALAMAYWLQAHTETPKTSKAVAYFGDDEDWQDDGED